VTRPIPAAELAARVQSVLEIPLHRFLGIALADAGRPAAGIVLPVEGPALNNADVLHGGILTALLDVASYLAVLPLLAAGENAVTHDVTASLVRAVPAAARVHIAGTVLHRARRVVFLRAEATVDGAIVAAGQSLRRSSRRGPGQPPGVDKWRTCVRHDAVVSTRPHGAVTNPRSTRSVSGRRRSRRPVARLRLPE